MLKDLGREREVAKGKNKEMNLNVCRMACWNSFFRRNTFAFAGCFYSWLTYFQGDGLQFKPKTDMISLGSYVVCETTSD